MSCPDCFKGSVHGHVSPKGELTKVHGVECYVTPPQSTSVTNKSVIVYFTDGFGLDLVNNKVLADCYAEGTGARVYAPNLFIGGPAPIAMLHALDGVDKPVGMMDIWGQTKKLGNTFSMLTYIVPFLRRTGPAKCYDSGLEFTRKVRAEMPAEGKLGVAGPCWGGYFSTRLCTETRKPDSSERLVDAAFTAHPSALKAPGMILDAVRKFNTPYSLAQGERDMVMSPKVVEQARDILTTESKEKPTNYVYEFSIYKNMAHGFAVRGDHEEAEVREKMDEARQQAITWFKKYL